MSGYVSGPIRSVVASSTLTADTLTSNDYVLEIDATYAGGNFSEVLPGAAACQGRIYIVKKVDTSANAVVLTDNSGAQIDNAAQYVLNKAGAMVGIQSDGRQWVVIGGSLDALLLAQNLIAWAYAQAFCLVTATRDSNEAIVTGSIVWPDGATGTFTTDSASTAFPGAIDAWHATYINGPVTKTVTQALVTRDSGGAVVAQPPITIA